MIDRNHEGIASWIKFPVISAVVLNLCDDCREAAQGFDSDFNHRSYSLLRIHPDSLNSMSNKPSCFSVGSWSAESSGIAFSFL